MLSFITLIAYDFHYALRTIRSYYDIADEIILGLDQDRISFAGRPFPFDDDAFRRGLAAIDSEGKIRVIEANFHTLAHPMANDQYERQVLANACRPGNWIIQIDADEFLLNADEFAEWMRGVSGDVGIKARWVTIFKQMGDQYLLIEEPDAFIAIGSQRRDRYVASRETDQSHLRSPLVLLHQAWGRSRVDLELKLRNWAHSRDFDVDAYLRLWDAVSLDNFGELRDFHPVYPPYWPSLERVSLSDLG